jgi:hypothetical protein
MLPQAWAILILVAMIRRSLINLRLSQPERECGVQLRCELVKNGTLEFNVA